MACCYFTIRCPKQVFLRDGKRIKHVAYIILIHVQMISYIWEDYICNALNPLWRRWIALLTPHHSFHIIWAEQVQNSHYLKYNTSSDVKNDFEWQNPMTVHCVLIACLHKSTPHHSVKNYHYFEQTYTYNRIFSYPIPRASASGRTQFQTSRHMS